MNQAKTTNYVVVGGSKDITESTVVQGNRDILRRTWFSHVTTPGLHSSLLSSQLGTDLPGASSEQSDPSPGDAAACGSSSRKCLALRHPLLRRGEPGRLALHVVPLLGAVQAHRLTGLTTLCLQSDLQTSLHQVSGTTNTGPSYEGYRHNLSH